MKNKRKKINHIAIAVPNLEEAAANWERALGIKKSKVTVLKEHGVKVTFLNFENLKIELLEPLNYYSPIYKYLKKNPKGGIHHICFEVKNLNETIKSLNENKIGILDNGKQKIGAHNKPVIFLQPNDMSGTLVEFEEL